MYKINKCMYIYINFHQISRNIKTKKDKETLQHDLLQKLSCLYISRRIIRLSEKYRLCEIFENYKT